MLLNTFEFMLVNNPVRALFQRHLEARRLLKLGGAVPGGHALEIGCGRGVGVEIILDQFGAHLVDAFDLDPRMVRRAERRLQKYGERVSLWVGDATCINAPDATYDAVFDFDIIHHIPDWRKAVSEVFRVLKPGGRFYAEEMLKAFIHNPVARALTDHPLEDRFDHIAFLGGLEAAGFSVRAEKKFLNYTGWYISEK